MASDNKRDVIKKPPAVDADAVDQPRHPSETASPKRQEDDSKTAALVARPRGVSRGVLRSAAEDCAQDVDALVIEGNVALLIARTDHDHLGADIGAIEEMLDILVHHADAAR